MEDDHESGVKSRSNDTIESNPAPLIETAAATQSNPAPLTEAAAPATTETVVGKDKASDSSVALTEENTHASPTAPVPSAALPVKDSRNLEAEKEVVVLSEDSQVAPTTPVASPNLAGKPIEDSSPFTSTPIQR